MLLRVAKKAFRKCIDLFLRKTNQSIYVSRFLNINCQNPDKVHLYGKINFGTEPWILSFGENVYITDGVKFITHDGGTLLFRDKIPDLELTKPISVGSNVYIGNNAILLPGISIGDNVIIGAGAVVSKNVPSGEVWGGVPAKRIKSIDEYLNKAKRDSLHLGELSGEKKDKALRRYFSGIHQQYD